MDAKFLTDLQFVSHFYVDLSWRRQYAGVFKAEHKGITYYFIDNEYYFAGSNPYNNIYEDVEKFAYFSKAVLCTLPVIDFKPDVIHCHDWQTGLIPVYMDHFRYFVDFFKDIKAVMTIHNLKFQGVWSVNGMKEITGLPDYYFTSDKLEAYNDANMLKGGIVYADKVTTVSSTYSEEIKTPFYGERLDGLMNAR